MRHTGEHDDDDNGSGVDVDVGRSDGGIGSSDDDVPLDATAPTDAFREAFAQLGELKQYAAQYVAARFGSFKAGVRNGIAWAVLGVLALIAGTGMIVTAGALLVIGLAQAVAALLGGYAWAGNLIIGVVILGAIMLTAWIAIRRLLGASRTKTLHSYERRLTQQKMHHGHDARQRSAEQRRRDEHQGV